MLKIWGRTNSVNVKKVLWAAEELGLEYQRIDAGLQFGVNKTPEYLNMNPTGLVPTLEDDGFVLWESHTIVRYLAAKHGAGKLAPADLRRRAEAERWMDWTYTFQRELQRPLFWPLVRTPPEKRDPDAIEAARKTCAELLQDSGALSCRAALRRRRGIDDWRYPARLPRAALDAPADRAPGAAASDGVVRAPLRTPGVPQDRRHSAVMRQR